MESIELDKNTLLHLKFLIKIHISAFAVLNFWQWFLALTIAFLLECLFCIYLWHRCV